jgi:tRNA 2-thiouridine synthesizing protein A
MQFDRDIDAEGLLCPLPVLRAARALRGMKTGEVLRLRATDRAAVVDVPHFCTQDGHAFDGSEDHGAAVHYFIRKT